MLSFEKMSECSILYQQKEVLFSLSEAQVVRSDDTMLFGWHISAFTVQNEMMTAGEGSHNASSEARRSAQQAPVVYKARQTTRDDRINLMHTVRQPERVPRVLRKPRAVPVTAVFSFHAACLLPPPPQDDEIASEH